MNAAIVTNAPAARMTSLAVIERFDFMVVKLAFFMAGRCRNCARPHAPSQRPLAGKILLAVPQDSRLRGT